MAADRGKLPERSSDGDVAQFLDQVKRTPVRNAGAARGRLLFGIDATASREPTWDRACHLQAQMFEATASIGNLWVQLASFRGFGQFDVSPWLANAAELTDHMTRLRCLGGQTQIARVLRHAVAETKRERINALVYVGDCCEENVDTLCHIAGELALHGVPAFMFHEGFDTVAGRAFRQIATLTNGAYCRFDSASAKALRELLTAVAVYAVGGHAALEDYGRRSGGEVLRIADQMGRSRSGGGR